MKGRSESAFQSNMIATINFGSHTHLELSGPSFELRFLKSFVKNHQKIGLHLGSDFLEMDPIFKIFTPALKLLT